MRCSVQFSLRSPKAIGLSAVESADRISTFACMWHAHPLAAQSPAHSHRLQTQRRLIHCFFTLLYTCRHGDHTNRVFKPTQHDVGCKLSHFSVNFCKFLCPTLDTAARLVSSVFVLRFNPLNTTCCGFETKLSGVLLPSTPMLCSTHSRRLPLSFGDVVTSFNDCSNTCGLPYRVDTTTGSDRITKQAGKNHRIHSQRNTHAQFWWKIWPEIRRTTGRNRSSGLLCVWGAWPFGP